jgi:hypothetical protein
MEYGRMAITDGIWKDGYNGWNMERYLQRMENQRMAVNG